MWLVVKILWLIVFALVWFICHGGAFADGCKPMWRWPRPAGAPEWDTDFNGKARLFFTWSATIMDIGIAIVIVRWFLG